MGSPIGPEIEGLDAFVRDLRALWTQTGRIPFTTLARRLDASKSSLNDAVTRTDRLPTERVLAELVGFLAPDQLPTWLGRRSALENRIRDRRGTPRPPLPSPEPPVAPAPESRRSSPARRGFQGRRWVFVTVPALGVMFAAGFMTGRSTLGSIHDGQDPQSAGCTADAAVVAVETLPELARLKLVYSTHCNAYWAKLERLDGRSVGNQLHVAVTEMEHPERAQRAVDTDVTSSYSFLLIRTDPTVRYCATGALTVGGRKLSFRQPAC